MSSPLLRLRRLQNCFGSWLVHYLTATQLSNCFSCSWAKVVRVRFAPFFNWHWLKLDSFLCRVSYSHLLHRCNKPHINIICSEHGVVLIIKNMFQEFSVVWGSSEFPVCESLPPHLVQELPLPVICSEKPERELLCQQQGSLRGNSDGYFSIIASWKTEYLWSLLTGCWHILKQEQQDLLQFVWSCQ